jgi:hypothetical protein
MQPCKDFLWYVIFRRLWVLVTAEQSIDIDINRAVAQWERWDEQGDGRDRTGIWNELRRLHREQRVVIRMWAQEEALWESFGDVFRAAADRAEEQAEFYED